jgi:hypothetical protein
VSHGVSRATRAWVALALVGLVVAVSVSYAASQLSKPKVGLTSEPVSGLSELAPKSAPGKRTHRPRPAKRSPAPPPTTTPTTVPVPVPAERNDEGGDDD